MLEQDHEAILDALAGGLSIRKTAEQFRLPVDDVRKILKDEIARCRDGERLRQTWMLADRRLQAAELRFYKKAMEEGDCASAIVFVKISERRATLNGANMPQSHVLQIVSAPQPTQTSTERIREALVSENRNSLATTARTFWPQPH